MNSATTATKPGLPVRASIDIPWSARVLFVIGILGLALDALLAVRVFHQAFEILSLGGYGIAAGFGLIAAKATTVAATHYNSGKRGFTWVCLAAVLLMGFGLAWTRMIYGVSVDNTFGGNSTTSPTETALPAEMPIYNEWPAATLMLIIYSVSMTGVFLSALKIFHPVRAQLKVYSRRRQRLTRELAPMEADYVAIHERLGHAEAWQRELVEHREHVMAELDAREASLKAFSRIVIAREVGDPTATPLVRAPYQPEAQPPRPPSSTGTPQMTR